MNESTTTTSSPDMVPLCLMCDQPGIKRCSGCECSRYCSADCQKADWPVHKLLCKDYKHQSPSFPTPGVVRAIWFPVEGDRPRFTWILTHQSTTASDHSKVSIIHPMASTVPHNHTVDTTLSWSSNEVLHRPLSTKIYVTGGSPHFPDRDRRKNKSLKAIDAENDEEGDVFYYKGGNQNMDVSVLRHVVDFMRSILYEQQTERLSKICQTLKQPAISCVRVNCVGYMEITRRPAWLEPINLPLSCVKDDGNDPVPKHQRIGEHIMTPLTMDTLPTAPTWRNRMIKEVPAEHNPNLEHFSPTWKPSPGTVLVCRRDGKKLHVLHLQVLIAYCEKVRREGKDSEPEIHYSSGVRMWKNVSSKAFLQFYSDYGKANPTLGLTYIPDPYEV